MFVYSFVVAFTACLNNPIQRSVFSCAGLPVAQFVCYEVFSKLTVYPPVISAAFSVAKDYMGVSKNRDTPKSSILIGFSIINHPFWGFSPYFWKQPYIDCLYFFGGLHFHHGRIIKVVVTHAMVFPSSGPFPSGGVLVSKFLVGKIAITKTVQRSRFTKDAMIIGGAKSQCL